MKRHSASMTATGDGMRAAIDLFPPVDQKGEETWIMVTIAALGIKDSRKHAQEEISFINSFVNELVILLF